MKSIEDSDKFYDQMKDDFALCNTVKNALELIHYYGKDVAKKRLPDKYKYLLKNIKK